MPVQRIAAAAASCPRARARRCRRSSRRCTPSPADAPFNQPTGCGSRSSTATACSLFVDGTAGQRCARGAGSSSRQHFPRARGGARASRPCRRMILDGEIVAFDATASRRSTRCRTAAAEDRARHRGGREEHARWSSMPSTCCTSPASTCASAPYADRRRYLAQCLLPSPLVQLVHAVGRRRGALRRRARQRLRRRDRQAQAEQRTRPASARRPGSRSSRRKAPSS